MASILDMKSKEEKDAELDRKIEALRKKNEALVRRHQMIEEDRRRAEQEGIAVTTPRKAKHPDGEPDKARKEKENFSITLDVSAGEKRVVNDWKSPKASHTSPRSETSLRSPTHRTSGRTGPSSGGRSPHGDYHGEPFKGECDDSYPSERATRGRRNPVIDMSKRSPRSPNDDSPGERWTPSPRGAERGGRNPGRGGGMGGGMGVRGGVHGGPVDGISGPDRKVKEWEEKRKQNIEKMNEEMEKIAEYERSQRDGVREKNPIRNFLDDPRRTGPIADIDRKEGSRRHNRNWGGPDFEKVKTGMDREKESHGRRPGLKNQMDMTMSMTGKERAEYVRWKQERDQIDQERLARHRKPTGQWRREWDKEKTDSMFKEGATPNVEEEPVSRRDQGKRGAPKPPTMAEFLPESLKKPQRRKQNRSRAGSKPYSMHDSRWEEEEEEEEDVEHEKDKTLSEEKEKETCVEKAETKKAAVPEARTPEVSAAVTHKKNERNENLEGDDCVEDDEDWTDASVDEDEEEDEEEEDVEEDSLEAEVDHNQAHAAPATPKDQRLPKPAETPKLTMPPSDANTDERVVESKPTSPFSPEGHRPVTDWGEEMELLSPPESSSEDSPPQTASTRGSNEENFSPSGSTQNQNPAVSVVKSLTPVMESESAKSTEIKTNLEQTSPERLPEGDMESRTSPEESSSVTEEATVVEKTSLAQEGTSPAEEGTSPAEEGTSSAEEGTSPAEEGTSSAEEGTSSAEEETSSAEEETSSAEEGTSPAEEGTSPAEEGSSPAEDRSPLAEAVTTLTSKAKSPAVKETSPVKESSPILDETENSSAVSDEAQNISQEMSRVVEVLEGATKSVHIADFETQSTEVPPSSS